MVSSPAISGNGEFIYVGSHDNKVYCLEASSGAKVWSFETGNEVSSSPAISGNGELIYVGSHDTQVYAFRWQFVGNTFEVNKHSQTYICSPCTSCSAGKHTLGCGQGAGECVDCADGTFVTFDGGVRVNGCSKCPTCANGSVAPGCSPTSAGSCFTSPHTSTHMLSLTP